ncbi:hypothetical protein HDU67_008674 [Dinochytrium kinnereticum]|nr:hypothetical protein HDU67_008674 [Dinochytrium kinnereticum]
MATAATFQTSSMTPMMDYKSTVSALLQVPGNSQCADCKSKNPTHASTNLGVLLCAHCSSIHTKILGPKHISRILPLPTSSSQGGWTPSSFAILQNLGNARVNGRLMSAVDAAPPKSLAGMEEYIRDKYERKKFSMTGGGVKGVSRASTLHRSSTSASREDDNDDDGASSYQPDTAGLTSSLHRPVRRGSLDPSLLSGYNPNPNPSPISHSSKRVSFSHFPISNPSQPPKKAVGTILKHRKDSGVDVSTLPSFENGDVRRVLAEAIETLRSLGVEGDDKRLKDALVASKGSIQGAANWLLDHDDEATPVPSSLPSQASSTAETATPTFGNPFSEISSTASTSRSAAAISISGNPFSLPPATSADILNHTAQDGVQPLSSPALGYAPQPPHRSNSFPMDPFSDTPLMMMMTTQPLQPTQKRSASITFTSTKPQDPFTTNPFPLSSSPASAPNPFESSMLPNLSTSSLITPGGGGASMSPVEMIQPELVGSSSIPSLAPAAEASGAKEAIMALYASSTGTISGHGFGSWGPMVPVRSESGALKGDASKTSKAMVSGDLLAGDSMPSKALIPLTVAKGSRNESGPSLGDGAWKGPMVVNDKGGVSGSGTKFSALYPFATITPTAPPTLSSLKSSQPTTTSELPTTLQQRRPPLVSTDAPSFVMDPNRPAPLKPHSHEKGVVPFDVATSFWALKEAVGDVGGSGGKNPFLGA